MIPTNEFRVFGPPGTGKTTWLRKNVALAARTYGADSIIVTSFTKAAAVNLIQGEHGLTIPRNNVGTLHSLCLALLGKQEVADHKSTEWNQHLIDQKLPQQFSLTPSRAPNIEDPYADDMGNSSEDSLLNQLSIIRNRLVPIEGWPVKVRQFSEAWTRWKQSCGYIDFTDMVDLAYRQFDSYPGNKSILFVDEAQDLVPLHLAIIRKWGAAMEKFILVGDDDQTLYEWIGASPKALIQGIDQFPPEQVKQLSQSYRVPQAAHKLAERIIGKISDKDRYVKRYEPTDKAGSLSTLTGCNFQQPATIIKAVNADLQHEGRTVMILASCNYLLGPTLKALRQAGIPYWNPYRPQKADWNPLGHTKKNQTTTLTRFQALTVIESGEIGAVGRLESMAKWAECLQASAFSMRGMKTKFLALCKARPMTHFTDIDEFNSDLQAVFSPEIEDSIISADPNGFRGFWDKVKAPMFEHCTRIWNRDKEFMKNPIPRVTIGTLHSVKGGESDSVYVFPDLSMAGMQNYTANSQGQAQIRRLFYVGVTRTKDKLTLIPGQSSRKFEM